MAYLISKKTKSSYEKSLATVMSADLVTVIPMILYISIGLIYLILAEDINEQVTKTSLILLSLLMTGVTTGFLAWFKPGTIEKHGLTMIHKINGLTGRGYKLKNILEKKMEDWEKTLGMIGEKPKTLTMSLIITGSAFMFRMITFYLILTSLGLTMNPLKIMLLIPLISFASISPTPGGTGTYEAAMAGSIVLISSLSLPVALTVTILYRTVTYWQTTILGYISTTTMNSIPSTTKKITERN